MTLRLAAASPKSVRHNLVTVGLGAALLLAPALASGQNGYVSGIVRDAATQAPLSGITVELCSQSGCQSMVTQSQGGYFFAVPPGTYWVFTNNDIGYTNEIFDNILCQRECSTIDALHSGRLLSVQPTFGWNVGFDLDHGARIAGAVTSSATSQPLAGVEVAVYSKFEDWPDRVATATTDAAGAYAIDGLPAGRYFLRTYNSQGYVNEVYDNRACPPGGCGAIEVLTGVPIDVTSGSSVAGRDFALDPGGRITGTVTDAVTTLGQPGVCVYATTLVGGEYVDAGQDCTDSVGAYEVTGLPAGSYVLWSRAYQSNHISELYNNIPCVALTCDLTAATPVVVAAGGVTGGRDFALDAGGIIRGVMRDALTSAALDQAQACVGQRVGDRVVMIACASSVPGTGEYEIRGLTTGTYFAYSSASRYQNEIFDDVPCHSFDCTSAELASAGTPIAVTAAAATEGVDFSLRNDIAPAPPFAPSFSVNGSTVSLNWSPSSGGQPLSYVLEAGLSPGATIVAIPATEPSYLALGVAPGTYYVRVKAVNAFGISPPSEEVEVVVTAGSSSLLPGKPESPHGWMSGSRLTLMWETPLSRSALVTGYVVEAGSGPGLTNIAAIGVNARAFTFLPVPAGFYFVRVRAMSAYGLGPASDEMLINSGYVLAPPHRPWLERPVVSGRTVTLSWEAPEYETAPTSYVVRAGSAPGLSNLAEANVGPGRTATFMDVPPGRYYVRVHGMNGAGLGLASYEVVVSVR